MKPVSPDPTMHMLASDNSSGVHPEVLEAMVAANSGHVVSYGDDVVTRRAIGVLKERFGSETQVFFVLTGTGSNVLALSAMTPSYGAVLCSDCSHIATDECGAPERGVGCKLLTVDTHEGKIHADVLREYIDSARVPHQNIPSVVSITQSTELGTVYSAEEIHGIAGVCREAGWLLHMDGARYANACVHLDTDLAALSSDAGVDVLSLGATKNGAMYAEAVLVFSDRVNTTAMNFLRKQHTQLASKMRFAAAQFQAMFEGDLWYRNASQANAMAKRLADGARTVTGIEAMYPVQANGVFARLPDSLLEPARELQYFYDWEGEGNVVRWMTSFDSGEERIDRFVEGLRDIVS
jgi:threonine aldolase